MPRATLVVRRKERMMSRILKLLEEQHQKLARIIKSPKSQEAGDGSTERTKSPQTPPSHASSKVASSASPMPSGTSMKAKSIASAHPANRAGSQARDSSPSLAREIASRRGIPPAGKNQPSAAAQARARAMSPESAHRTSSAPVSAHMPTPVMDSEANTARRTKKADEDEGFAKFYNNLTTGTMSKLSSVLAYAGLPLTADDMATGSAASEQTVRASNDPDVKKIFSKATLAAVEEEYRRRGLPGHGFGPAESFYVVPLAGHTKSYATVAGHGSRPPKPPEHALVGEDDEEAFVDAQEAQGTPSPKQSRFSGRPAAHSSPRSGAGGMFGKGQTREELELENRTLKSTLDGMLTRLQQFEVHAQDASLAALTQSMAGFQRGPPDPALTERIRMLEQQVEKEAEERQKLVAHAMKQEKQLKKWHSNYEKLKNSAREKMKAKEKGVGERRPTEIGKVEGGDGGAGGNDGQVEVGDGGVETEE
ncbi:hypothetical protein M433DRAFT_510361 [Acidomyces richmondensis BFW]|nr:MAG: hypothetical protein FE78DRAFT_318402 [Acidomyces sp. 'richmondensis']KYG47215.1 hypothetical protein M433DRAFT_510361 [Acidomyces richmondensis BFW]